MKRAVALALALLSVGVGEASAATAATAPTRTVDADGLTIAYRSFGDGPPVVFVMGLSGTIDSWDPTFLDAIAEAGHRVIVFNNEGIGKSEARTQPLTIRRMGDNTAKLIDALHLKRPDVVGWSMGGMIAQSFAVRHPAKLRRLALLATAPGDGKATPPTAEGTSSLTSAANAGSALFPPGQTAARDRFFKNLTKRKNPSPSAPPAVTQKQLRASGAWLSGQDPDGKRITKLKARTLVGGGQLDQLLPVANQRHLATVIPNAQVKIYPDAAHGFFLQKAKDFVPRLTRFLRRAG
jgi:pimeloyl-ACP methyl ester carboxylesterase